MPSSKQESRRYRNILLFGKKSSYEKLVREPENLLDLYGYGEDTSIKMVNLFEERMATACPKDDKSYTVAVLHLIPGLFSVSLAVIYSKICSAWLAYST